ncbi:U2 snRNP auxilliary factor [Striga asiatica]|uniref:U2 snRNP auxilliary factor n=1 Tax=Striga asiatica TaxID=4170 RepID=A0A5A7Q5V7_STRAF|nr:U2 snRNP auxilliary factor [Striga asiatica]
MSRCFPFPPPGYERKHRSEGLDLLKEAKCKEKKHKKEKKDKERKKEKEKEREGSSAKHKDKKDRKNKSKEKKEKHREKKDKGKDKDKSSISEESTVARNEGNTAEKFYPVEYSKESRNFGNEGKCPAQLQDQNGGKPSQNSLPSLGNEESKFVQELDRRVRDEKSRGSQLPEKLSFTDKKDWPMLDANKNKRDPGNFKNEVSGNMMVQKVMPIAKSKGEGIPRPMNAENGWRLEDKEKYKETAGRKPGDNPNDTGKEIHEKDQDNEMKKYDEAKIKNENKKGSRQGKLEDEGRDNLGGCDGRKSTSVLNGYNSNTVDEENIKKRKDMGTNGFLHEREIRPIKMQRSSSHQSTENGRQLEPPRTLVRSSNDKQAVPSNVEVDNNERLTNGTFEAQKPSSSIPNTHAATVQIVEFSKLPQFDSNSAVVTAEASRSPHPDSKYLAEVLTVPKNMSDLSENDDQLWLFGDRVPRKPKLDSFEFDDNVHVWSEAVHIESADICALPYVVPY